MQYIFQYIFQNSLARFMCGLNRHYILKHQKAVGAKILKMPGFTFCLDDMLGFLSPDEFTPRHLHICDSQVGVPVAWVSVAPGVVFALHFTGPVYLI